MRKLVFLAIAEAYAVGETLQQLLIGPSWIRFYLSDFGFPASVALVLGLVGLGYRKGILIGLLVALVWESIQFSEQKGDPVDVVVFLLGATIAFIFAPPKNMWDES